MAEIRNNVTPLTTDTDSSSENVLSTQRFTALREELDARSRMQTAVAELGQAALTDVDATLLASQVCALAADTLHVNLCRALEHDSDRKRFVNLASIGFKAGKSDEALDGEALYAFYSRAPVIYSSLAEETRFASNTLTAEGVASGVTVTLSVWGEPFGVFGIYSTTRREFREYEIEFVVSISNVLAAALASRRAQRELAETRAEIGRREKLGSIGSWIWGRGQRTWIWSEEIFRLFGLDPESVVSDFGTFLNFVHPEDRPAFSSLVERASHVAGQHELEHRIVTSNEEPRVVRSVVEGIFGQDGKPVRLIGTTHDITTTAVAIEEKARLSALIELAAQEWRTTCDAINAAVILLDRNATVLRLNERARALWAVPFDDAIGASLPGFEAGEPWATIRQIAVAVSETGIQVRAEAIDSSSGRQWEFSGQALSHDGQADERIVILATDVTEQANKERVRREADVLDTLTQFIRSLRRRVELPLSKLSDVLATGYSSIELGSDESKSARASVFELSRLIRELDDYAQPFTLDDHPKGLAPVLYAAIESLAADAARFGVTVDSRVEDAPPILLNEERLGKLFTDMLGIFVGRADEGSTIRVTLDSSFELDSTWVNVEIASGRMLFTRAERAAMLAPHSASLLRDDSLRLSVDRRIVDEHGGSLSLSARDDGGSSICLRFPAFRLM